MHLYNCLTDRIGSLMLEQDVLSVRSPRDRWRRIQKRYIAVISDRTDKAPFMNGAFNILPGRFFIDRRVRLVQSKFA